MGSFGGLEWLLIILIVLLLFGARKIPELARGISQGISEFRKVSDEEHDEIDQKGESATKDKNSEKSSGAESKKAPES